MVIVDVVEISLWEQRSVMFKVIFISRINVLLRQNVKFLTDDP